MRLNFQNFKQKTNTVAVIEGISLDIRIHVTCRILEKSNPFRFIQTPYLDKVMRFLVTLRLAVEINILYGAFLTGHLGLENNLSNA